VVSGRVKILGAKRRKHWFHADLAALWNAARQPFLFVYKKVFQRTPKEAQVLNGRKPRVRPRDIVIPRCQVCSDPLRSGPTVSCQHDPPHRIHESCRSLVKGKCPVCGSALAQAMKA
jgi:hypothetical protein